MSLAALSIAVSELPFVLREQVIGYAESVKAALPDISREAGVKSSPELQDQVVFLAGVRKLHALVASSYWALDNSAALLERENVFRIRVGSQDLSRGGEIHQRLKKVLEAIEKVLEDEDLDEVLNMPYQNLVQKLAGNGRP